jgi:phage shock protein PspC (stress-responsive transcriptional regulator)
MKAYMDKKLYRSKKDRWVGGVCGGLGEYLNIDPIIIRLITIVLILSAGGGLIVYIIAWLVVPEEPDLSTGTDESQTLVDIAEITVPKAKEEKWE